MEGRTDVSADSTFTWKGRTGPFALNLAPSVFAPTTTSVALAAALDVRDGETVIDVGAGCGVLSFVAARMGAGRVYGVEISEESVRVARENARRLGLEDRVEFRSGSLFDPVRDVAAGVVIGDVSGIPDEIAEVSGWFPGGYAGGPTGAEVPVAMLESVGDCLEPGGRMYLPTASLQDEQRVIEAARRVFGPSNIEAVAEREFPLPGLVARSREMARLMGQGLVSLRAKGSRLLWRLAIWRCVRT